MDLSKIKPNNGDCSKGCPHQENNHCALTGERVSLTSAVKMPISSCTPDMERKALAYARMKSKAQEEYRQKEHLERQIKDLEEVVVEKDLKLSRLKEDLARLKEQRDGNEEEKQK